MARRHVLEDLSYFALAMQIKKIRKATVYLSPKCVVKMTARFRSDRRKDHHDFVVTVGTPNYAERKFIKLCKKAGEKLPLRKGPIFKFWPERKRAAK